MGRKSKLHKANVISGIESSRGAVKVIQSRPQNKFVKPGDLEKLDLGLLPKGSIIILKENGQVGLIMTVDEAKKFVEARKGTEVVKSAAQVMIETVPPLIDERGEEVG
jgi:hypothetical protein